MNKINEVYETNDYSQFKFLNNNRDISTKHVNKLIKSMKEKIAEAKAKRGKK